ncbi:MAG: DUF58 domain-containing protein [Rhodospirillales bacterium]|nr:DUF58 domain-containing protein [Rhodospirillales bacterium]
MAARLADIHAKAEILSANLPPLMVAADRVAATVSQGLHGRRRVGQGETFWQYRRYEWGDPVAQIDWRRSAKSDTVFLRENEWEAAQSVWIWSDGSPSMKFSSARDIPEKSERADLLALAVASLLVQGGEHIAALGRRMIPSTGRSALLMLAQAMEERNAAADQTASLPPFEPLPRYGRAVLFGDFLEPKEELYKAIGRLADRGVRGHLVQVLDPAEHSLPFGGRTRFEGMEDEGSALIGRVEGVRGDYQQAMEKLQLGLKDIARSTGWDYQLHMTDHPPEAALLRLYTALALPRGR